MEVHYPSRTTSKWLCRVNGKELQKKAIKRAIGEQKLTPFELYTGFLEVANLVNQRPIGWVSKDPDDGAYLCPNDMLLGRATSEVPQGPFKSNSNPRLRVEFVQQIDG